MIFRATQARPHWLLWLLICLMLLPVWLSIRTVWGAATLQYELTPAELIIHFGPKTTRIDRDAITDVTLLEQVTKGRRNFGTGLPNLKEGRFTYAETGRITLFATSTRPLTVIATPDQKWGISPADATAFQRALTAGETGVFRPVASASTWGSVSTMILPVMISLGVIGLLGFLLRMSRRIAYELGSDALIVHGGLSPVRIPYAKMEAVESASPGGFPWRSFGIGMPGLHWGYFSWKAAGGRLKLYATRLRPLVLIRAGRQTYGLTPADEERFMAELAQRIAR